MPLFVIPTAIAAVSIPRDRMTLVMRNNIIGCGGHFLADAPWQCSQGGQTWLFGDLRLMNLLVLKWFEPACLIVEGGEPNVLVDLLGRAAVVCVGKDLKRVKVLAAPPPALLSFRREMPI